MNLPFKKDSMAAPIDAAFIDRLKQIYAAMDRVYNRAAGHYGFACDGCQESCCRSRFYHHTIIEYDYLIKGLKTLDSEKLKEVTSRALLVVDETARADQSGTAVRLMCPLNFDELCILYSYRPMICRLHGIPHELRKPGQNPVYGSGCDTFDRRCGHKSHFKFDRTPFYRQLAMLEQEVKQALGVTEKFKITIAEMIISHANGIGHGARGEGYVKRALVSMRHVPCESDL
jgi:Fe-S-cluster containining protein